MSDHSYVAADPAMEYLDTGAPAPGPAPRRKARPWAPIVGGVAVFIVALLVIGAVAGDWVGRSLEMRQLLTQIEVSEQAMASTQVDVADAIEEFQSKQAPTDADQEALKAALQAAAAKGLVGVIEGGGLVESVRIVPWHSGIKQAQQAYLAHNKAWQDYLTRASKDAAEFTVTQEAVNSTFEAAEKPIRSAVPKPDLFKLGARVNVIYAADPTAAPGSGQQA